jgi:hypothetical protein
MAVAKQGKRSGDGYNEQLAQRPTSYLLWGPGLPYGRRMTRRTSAFEKLQALAGHVLTPSAPIDDRDLFAGRGEQLMAMLDAVNGKGQHIVVHGERGVGKTSLVSILPHMLDGIPVVRVNCSSAASYGSLWAQALGEIKWRHESKMIGFAEAKATGLVTLAQQVSGAPAMADVINVLKRFPAPMVFIFDEFDQADAVGVRKEFADTIKALSDYSIVATIVLVGVGDDVRSLISAHASIERALVQIPMPRMKSDELVVILDKAAQKLKISFSKEAAGRIVRLAQGLPQYVHLLGLHATRHALEQERLSVTARDFDEGVKTAISRINQSVSHAYTDATTSHRKDTLFKKVLLACALAKVDEHSTFASTDLRVPLNALGLNLDIPAFASHLNKFSSGDRGNILQKMGVARRYRYRFSNPLVQPYVIMRGLADKAVTMTIIDHIIRRQASKAAV